jgi:hypothetical protein
MQAIGTEFYHVWSDGLRDICPFRILIASIDTMHVQGRCFSYRVMIGNACFSSDGRSAFGLIIPATRGWHSEFPSESTIDRVRGRTLRDFRGLRYYGSRGNRNQNVIHWVVEA